MMPDYRLGIPGESAMKQAETHARVAQWLIIVLCVLQPTMSILSYWLITWGGNTNVTLALRFVVLIGTTGAACAMADRRAPFLWVCVGGTAFYAVHLWTGWRAGSFGSLEQVFTDLTNYIRVLHIPLMTLSLQVLLKRAAGGYRALIQGLTVAFFIIAAVELLSVLTGTNPYTYVNKQIGIIGWFYLPSAQSAVLTMLFPPVLAGAIQDKAWKTSVISAVGFAELYCFATRLAYLAIFITGFGLALVFLATDRSRKKQIAVVLFCTLVCGAGFFVSPMKQNQDLVAENAAIRQEQYNELVQQGQEEFGTEGSRYLTYVYEDRLEGLVDRFGMDTVAEYFDYTTDASVLADVRRVKRSYCELLLRQSPGTARWFGLAYPEMTWKGTNYDVENDLHGILYLYGYVGLGLLILYLGWFVWQILRELCRDFAGTLTPELGAVGISLCCGLLHAWFTAGLLRRPNASFYLSAALAAAWYLVRCKTGTEEPEK